MTRFHMVTTFDLKPDVDIEAFSPALADYTAHLRGLDLVEACGPIGRRQSDTILDTDGERPQAILAIMTFRDRGQADRAVDYIKSHSEPGQTIHHAVYSKVRNQIFICFEDI